MPRFSVIVPAYNVEEYLEKCIKSVLNQTYKDFELIVVDDGSPDSSGEIADKYGNEDNRVKIIHKKNGGLVSARQAGANVAIGEYIICLDGDDWLDEVCLERFNQIITEYNSDIVCCGSIWAYTDNNISHSITDSFTSYNKEQIIQNVYPQLIEDKNGRYFPPTVWAKAFRREAYIKMQMEVDTKINIGEDHACTKPIIYNVENISVIPDCLYYYRQNDASMTKVPKAFSWEIPMLLSKHMEKIIPMDKYDFQKQVYRFTIHNLFNVCSSQFNRNEKYEVIKKDIIDHINISYYKKAVKNCEYNIKNWKGMLAKITIKYKLIWMMQMYNKMKNRH